MAEEKIFQCRQCGHCCHGETTVSLDEQDMVRLADYLQMEREEMIRKYLRVTGNVIQMKIVDGHCIFYRAKGCSVHPGKPWRCRQWPLHDAILTDEANFSAIKDSCPGINRSISYAEFCRRLKERLAAHNKAC